MIQTVFDDSALLCYVADASADTRGPLSDILADAADDEGAMLIVPAVCAAYAHAGLGRNGRAYLHILLAHPKVTVMPLRVESVSDVGHLASALGRFHFGVVMSRWLPLAHALVERDRSRAMIVTRFGDTVRKLMPLLDDDIIDL